jgi:hypothetical protein
VTVPEPVPSRLTVNTRGAKVAIACWLVLSVTVQEVLVPLPLHAPPHPTKYEFAPGVSVSVTRVPALKLALQFVGQLIPEGLLVTVPVPFPARPTLNIGALAAAKVTVTCWLALSVTVQVELLPLHAPVHPTKDELVAAVAVRVIGVLRPKLALHVDPQLIPEGLLVTLPWPLPLRVTVSTGEALKLAITEVLCVNVTLQTPVPLQVPDHPAK